MEKLIIICSLQVMCCFSFGDVLDLLKQNLLLTQSDSYDCPIDLKFSSTFQNLKHDIKLVEFDLFKNNFMKRKCHMIDIQSRFFPIVMLRCNIRYSFTIDKHTVID